jgi:hypothetical protein
LQRGRCYFLFARSKARPCRPQRRRSRAPYSIIVAVTGAVNPGFCRVDVRAAGTMKNEAMPAQTADATVAFDALRS